VATTLTIQILADVAKAVSGIDSIDKKTSTFGSTMKGLGATIGGALSLDKIEGWVSGWVDAGLQASRAAKNVSVTFGAAGADVQKWAEETGTHFGMTASEAEMAAAKVGVALKGYGFSATDAASASEKLVQRSADIAKVLGVDQEQVLAKVETAMRGRTAGLKDYGVQVDKGATSTQVLNAFMEQTATYSGQADTGVGNLHATMGNLSEQLGTALLPVIKALIPLLQGLGNWARNNKVAFDVIVIVVIALAVAFSVAATAAGIFAVAQGAALWPILAVVAGIAALIAVIVVVVTHWSTLVGWLHTAASAVMDFVGRFQILIALFGGPFGIALVALKHFHELWAALQGVIAGVEHVIQAVAHAAEIALGPLEKFADFVSHIPGAGLIFGHSAPAGAGPSPSAYGVTPAGVTFSPTINISGDVGDPVLAGRRIVAALEAWTAANGRRRIASLVAP
jgi:hypothetical protein